MCDSFLPASEPLNSLNRIYTTFICLWQLLFHFADYVYNFHSGRFIIWTLFIFTSSQDFIAWLYNNYFIHATVHGFLCCFQSLLLLNKFAQMYLCKYFYAIHTGIEILL